MTRVCVDCGDTLDETRFYIREIRPSGKVRRFKRCPKCHAAFNNRPDKGRPIEPDPERQRLQRRAWRLLDTAVWRGTVKKSDRCEECGVRLPKEKIEGHHDDYGKPYEVRWVCRACHEVIHPSPYS